MSTPTEFTFRALLPNLISWPATDASGNPITAATVVATLYANRSLVNPVTTPGTIADTNLNNLAMTETPPSSGIYVATVSPLFNPPAAGTGYVLVITASKPTLIDTWEIPSVVVDTGLSNDLVTLDQVKDWLGINCGNTDADVTLQFLISAFSQYVYNKTGRDTFNAVKPFTETYDGNGASRIFLRNNPIVSLVSLIVGSSTVPISAGLAYPGIFIEQSGKSIAFRSSGWSLFPPTSIFPYRFVPGIGNILVSYTAGYTSVPFDLGEACMIAVSQNYRRKDWIDLASKSLSVSGGSGTTRYRDWALPPYVMETIRYYMRYARS